MIRPVLKIIIKSQNVISYRYDINDSKHSGLMALNRVDGSHVLCRTVPDNKIVIASLHGNCVANIRTLIAPQYIHTVNRDIGFQDPTVIDANHFVFSRAYSKENKVYCDLVLASQEDSREYSLKTILRPMDCDALDENVDMVKELEFIDHGQSDVVLFEYTDGRSSHIAQGNYHDGKITNLSTFLRAEDDGSEHVSTCGSPIRLDSGDWLLFFNRCRDSVWGVTWLTLSPDLVIDFVSEEYVILPKKKARSGMSIAFGSCVSVIDGQIEILYHEDDRIPVRALISLSQ